MLKSLNKLDRWTGRQADRKTDRQKDRWKSRKEDQRYTRLFLWGPQPAPKL